MLFFISQINFLFFRNASGTATIAMNIPVPTVPSTSLSSTHLNTSNENVKPQSTQGLPNNQTDSRFDQMLIPVVAQTILENSQKFTPPEPTNAPSISDPTKIEQTIPESSKVHPDDPKTPTAVEIVPDQTRTTVKPDSVLTLHQSGFELNQTSHQLDPALNKTTILNIPNQTKLSNTTQNISHFNASQTLTNTSADGLSGSNKMPNDTTKGTIEQNVPGLYQSQSLNQSDIVVAQAVTESPVDHQSDSNKASAIATSTTKPQLDLGQANLNISPQMVPSALEIIPPIETTSSSTPHDIQNTIQTPFKAENISNLELNATNFHSDTTKPPTAVLQNIDPESNMGQLPTYPGHTEPLANQSIPVETKAPTIVHSEPNTTIAILDTTQLSVREQNITKLGTNGTNNETDRPKPPTAVLQSTAPEITMGQSPTYSGHAEPLTNQQSSPEGTKAPNIVQSEPNRTTVILDPNELSLREENITKLDTNATNINKDRPKPSTSVLQSTSPLINMEQSPTYSSHAEPLANQSIPEGTKAPTIVQSISNTTIAILDPTQLSVREQNISKLDKIEHSDPTKPPTVAQQSAPNATKISTTVSNIATHLEVTKSPTYGMESIVPEEPSKMPNIEQSTLELNINHASTQSDNQENESHR